MIIGTCSSGMSLSAHLASSRDVSKCLSPLKNTCWSSRRDLCQRWLLYTISFAITIWGTMSILKTKTKTKRYKILCPKSMRAMVILQISEGVLQSAGSKLPMQCGGITEDQIKTTVIVFKTCIYAVVCVPICVPNQDSTGSLLPHLFHYSYQFSVQCLCNKPFFSCHHARQSRRRRLLWPHQENSKSAYVLNSLIGT